MRHIVLILAAMIIVMIAAGGATPAYMPSSSDGAGPLAAKPSTGILGGTVTREADGTPVQYANVVLVGTKMGGMTLSDGSFLISGIPAGDYTVRVMMMGYRTEEKAGVRVVAGKRARVDFRIVEQIAGRTEEIVVEGEVKQIEVGSSDVAYKTSAHDLQVMGGRSGDMSFQSSNCAPASGSMQPFDWPVHNTEEYAHIDENRFHDVITSPQSTFSIDVDGAAYANVRRFVMADRLPMRDAVRIEELINYFDYDYVEPRGNEPFSINLEYSECPWNGEHRLVHIGLQGKGLSDEERKPSNLVFLIDVSGSMQPANKLPLLRKAFKLLVGQLADDDRVSIVVYASSTGMVLPPTPGSRKAEIIDAIERLESGGSTAGGAGIQLAYRIASENFLKNGNNRVILATDGDFNVGISSTSELVEYIEGKRDEGIFLTVLGFGMDNYKDNRLEQLADKGNGNHAYIDNIMEAKKVLVNEVTSTLYTIAKDVKIQVEFNPARVASYRLIGYENRMLATEDFTDDKKDAGEIGAGHTVTALYEIVPAGKETRSDDGLRYQDRKVIGYSGRNDELLFVKIRYKEPDGDSSREIREIMKDEPVRLSHASDDFRFSAAVAMYGLVLRNSGHKGSATLEGAVALARDARGKDPWQYRAEFVSVVERTSTLMEIGATNEALNR
ncbi:MAG: von Willebrand factor type A domain-containing protein [Candidatus Krumholzibacteria bacterium]|jgi:Ca-activated chloride channel family protein|nr:von Willebrand factor type A domain-containing protein [Candidatus Krumholzibacteria bacterium]